MLVFVVKHQHQVFDLAFRREEYRRSTLVGTFGTTAQPVSSKGNTFDNTIFFDGNAAKSRATYLIYTGSRHLRRDYLLIAREQPRKHPIERVDSLHKGGFFLFGVFVKLLPST